MEDLHVGKRSLKGRRVGSLILLATKALNLRAKDLKLNLKVHLFSHEVWFNS
jgi:hypothetical protein